MKASEINDNIKKGLMSESELSRKDKKRLAQHRNDILKYGHVAALGYYRKIKTQIEPVIDQFNEVKFIKV
jgi:hypothetical protein